MPFEKGRKKTGGRKRGTVNSVKKPARLIDEFEQLHPGLNPLSELAKLALDSETDLPIRASCLKELLD